MYVIGLSPNNGINGRFGSAEKKFSINFTKSNTKFYLSLHNNSDNSYLFFSEKEIIKFKADNKNVNFLTRFCLGSISDGFNATEFREVSLNRNVYVFQSTTILLINLTY